MEPLGHTPVPGPVKINYKRDIDYYVSCTPPPYPAAGPDTGRRFTLIRKKIQWL